ncbi:MAG: TRAP transporter small permease subunit [Parvularculaceae bacterium]
MNALLRTLNRLSSFLERGATIFASSSLILMTVCVLIQIVARYIFSEPPAWTEELARHAMIWSGFSGATAAYSRRADPVLVNYANFKRAWMRQCAQFIEIIAVFLFSGAVLLAAPAFMTLHRDMLTETLQAPLQIVIAIIPLSMAVLAFHAAVRLLTLIFHGRSVSESAK